MREQLLILYESASTFDVDHGHTPDKLDPPLKEYIQYVLLEDHLVYTHGTIAKPNNSSSIEYLKQNPYVNTVHGHSHRAEIQWRTTPTDRGFEQRFAMSPGTLSGIRGEVPSYHNTIDEQGKIVNRAENWQQGVALIHHNERLAHPELAMILDDKIMIEGKTYGLQ